MKQADIDHMADAIVDRLGSALDIINLIYMIEDAPLPLAEAIEQALNEAGFYRQPRPEPPK